MLFRSPVEPTASIASLIEATIDELPISISGMAPISLRAPPASVPMSSPRPSVAEALAALRADPVIEEDPELMAARLPRLAKQALLEGDLATLDQVLLSLRVTGEHDALVDRMSAFHCLGKGNHAEAFRRLSTAEELTGQTKSMEGAMSFFKIKKVAAPPSKVPALPAGLTTKARGTEH